MRLKLVRFTARADVQLCSMHPVTVISGRVPTHFITLLMYRVNRDHFGGFRPHMWGRKRDGPL